MDDFRSAYFCTENRQQGFERRHEIERVFQHANVSSISVWSIKVRIDGIHQTLRSIDGNKS
ncbi:MAG: hypothetical protein K0Q73_5293 [Paenibacillus sp.]|jgi:hypothetical protein|nr:hypothetical protein [Paenibacillus sp.]MDF2787916.1 hypothetical protein [Neobacillus sp.]